MCVGVAYTASAKKTFIFVDILKISRTTKTIFTYVNKTAIHFLLRIHFRNNLWESNFAMSKQPLSRVWSLMCSGVRHPFVIVLLCHLIFLLRSGFYMVCSKPWGSCSVICFCSAFVINFEMFAQCIYSNKNSTKPIN